jgi:hypothetical protein
MLSLFATLGADNKPVLQGLHWRIFTADSREPVLMAQSQEGTPAIPLPPGDYVVHVAYGLASATRRLTMGTGNSAERLVLGAGGLLVKGAISEQEVPPARLSISVFIPAPGNSEGKLIASNLKGGELLRLPEGTYHVVSQYEDSNSTVRADIRVQPGKVTEATMNHRAATITLTLVSQRGGEAIANTAWSVLTPGGDVIREAIGAFPKMTLAEGGYVAIARHGGQVFQSDFQVKSGFDRDIEVLAHGGQPIGQRPAP